MGRESPKNQYTSHRRSSHKTCVPHLEKLTVGIRNAKVTKVNRTLQAAKY
jgi:hypothetical protein